MRRPFALFVRHGKARVRQELKGYQMRTDTIAAIATGMGNSGIGIVRISGSEAFTVIDKLYRNKDGRKVKVSQSRSHTVHYGFIYDGDEKVDEALVLIMKGPHSYTAEDTVEIDCHGGILMVKKILEAVIHAGARTAEPGEFTKRAFLNGRIDLSQAEAVADVINATNEYALKSSVSQLSGSVSKRIKELRSRILYQIAFIESALDDPEHISLEGYEDELMEKLDPMIGREGEMERLMQVLCRRTKNNPCLIGDPGVGKTAIVEGLAQRIADGNMPRILKNKRILSLDLTKVIAGTKFRGEFEERMKRIVTEATQDDSVILFIDEIHTIIGAGGSEGAMDASNILKPALARGDFQLIGATTSEEYTKYFEKDAALVRRFQPVRVKEPTVEETVTILKGIKYRFEDYHRILVPEDVVEAIAGLSDRYISDRFLPDKAIDLLDEACARKRMEQVGSHASFKEERKAIAEVIEKIEKELSNGDILEAKNLKAQKNKLEKSLERKMKRTQRKENEIPQLTVEDAAEVVSLWTQIPVTQLTKGDMERLRNLEKELHKYVIGQDEAVKAVAKAVKRSRVGLKSPNRPIGSFLFLGPTGVGKTELSKTLARALFGREEDLIRVDMSEYMEKHSVSKIIGSPPGYVGFGEGGQLSEQIRRHPYSVILFDEIEKAHPDVFNILLQVLDDGHITDSNGRKVDFKNTVIIMTSNAGANRIIAPKYLGFSVDNTDKAKNHERMKKGVMEEVKQIFRPEFLNRIDETIVFAVLTKEEVKKIAKLFIDELKVRLLNEHQITLKITSSAMDLLADKGYDENYGARPLRRVIQNEIEDVLADKILEGTLSNGQTMTIGKKDKKLTFSVKETSK